MAPQLNAVRFLRRCAPLYKPVARSGVQLTSRRTLLVAAVEAAADGVERPRPAYPGKDPAIPERRGWLENVQEIGKSLINLCWYW